MKAFLTALALVFLSACGATHQVKFDPWRGLSTEVAEQLKKGELPYPRADLVKAAALLLENEPFFKWELNEALPTEGRVKAEADNGAWLDLEIQGGAGVSALSLSPTAAIAGVKKVWINKLDPLLVTPYDIEFGKREPWKGVHAEFKLDQDYFVSALYRKLTDQSAVPFALEEKP